MKYEQGKKITDNCQFKKGKKYMDKYEDMFEFSHIGETGSPYFKDEGQGYDASESEYNCIGFACNDFYEAIEVTPELPAEGLVVHKKLGSIVYRTSKATGYGFSKYGTFENYNDSSTIWSFKHYPEDWRLPTPEEESKFIELLKKECERRGLYEDTKIKECLFQVNDPIINTGHYWLCKNSESVWNKNGCIFDKGKFAEPLEEKEEILEEKEETTTLDDKIKELIELGRSKGLKINVTFE